MTAIRQTTRGGTCRWSGCPAGKPSGFSRGLQPLGWRLIKAFAFQMFHQSGIYQLGNVGSAVLRSAFNPGSPIQRALDCQRSRPRPRRGDIFLIVTFFLGHCRNCHWVNNLRRLPLRDFDRNPSWLQAGWTLGYY